MPVIQHSPHLSSPGDGAKRFCHVMILDRCVT